MINDHVTTTASAIRPRARPTRALPPRPDTLTVGFDGRFLQDKFDGIGRSAFNLLKALATLDGAHRIFVFVDDSQPNTRFSLQDLGDLGRLDLVTTRVPLRNVRELGYWWRQARRLQLDLFHTPDFWSPLMMACPVVSHVHDMIPDISPDYQSSRAFGVGYKLTSRAMMWHARAIIAPSEATRRDIRRYAGSWAERKTTVIYNGLDTRFRPVTVASALAAVRAKYGLPNPFVLAVGRRRPHKNIASLVTAFAALPDLPHRLVLVGAPDPHFRRHADPGARHLEGRVVELTSVTDDELSALYSMAELFVHPSLAEGFGFPVLEAMACGCPVACSNAASLPELVDGAALEFDPRSPGDIAVTMRRALDSPDLREALRRRGFARASTFSWEKTGSATLKLYHAVVAGSSKSAFPARTRERSLQ
jgi:glycosyltransferase involved in cell wall biosynthesis